MPQWKRRGSYEATKNGKGRSLVPFMVMMIAAPKIFPTLFNRIGENIFSKGTGRN
jgi:hypothetical protein